MERIIAVLNIPQENKTVDLDIPLDITANDLLLALNEAYNLQLDIKDKSQCVIKTENPIAMIKGNKTLRDFMLRNGTVINIT